MIGPVDKERLIPIVIVGVAVTIGFAFLFAALSTRGDATPAPYPQPATTTSGTRSAFIDGCTSVGTTEAQCACMLDGLTAITPDLLSNEAQIQRTAAGDFTDAEVRAMTRCL